MFLNKQEKERQQCIVLFHDCLINIPAIEITVAEKLPFPKITICHDVC